MNRVSTRRTGPEILSSGSFLVVDVTIKAWAIDVMGLVWGLDKGGFLKLQEGGSRGATAGNPCPS